MASSRHLLPAWSTVCSAPRLIVIALISTGLSVAAMSSAIAQEDDPAAINLHTIGNNAYEQKDYPLAVDQWNKLLNEYPNYSARRQIKFLIGQAWFQQKNYEQALTEFRELRDSIPVIASYPNGPALLVFLGFSQFSVAKATEDPAKATELLQASIDNYTLFQEHFASDTIADQALFFQGESLSQLNQINLDPKLLERAADAYQSVIVSHPQSPLVPKALAEFASCLEQSGKYEEALKQYTDFQTRFPENDQMPVVQLRAAETVLKLGVSRQNSGDSDEAAKYFDDAIKRFDQLASDEKFGERDFALYRKAFCLQQVPDMKAAATAYATLANDFPESRLVAEATLNAGKFYFASGNIDGAQKWLSNVVSKNMAGKEEATHWLCRIHLEQKRYDEALALASAATENEGGGAFRVNLLVDAADALHEIPDRRIESIPLYRSVVAQYPTDPLSPRAQYYAAYANMSLGQFQDAIDDARKFKTDYPTHELLPATLQVLGDSALKVDEHALAQSTFEDLLNRFPEDASASWWKTRVGWSLYLQDKNDEAIAFLTSALVDMKDPVSRSESYYVAGSSQFRKADYGKAVDAFELALRENDKRSDANAIRLLMSRSYYQLKDLEKARTIAGQVLENNPDAETSAEAHFRLGEFEYELGDFKKAIAHYAPVIDGATPSGFLPDALYSRAWALKNDGQMDAAVADFTRLIDEFPDSPNGKQALLGRAAALRADGQFAEAIKDLDAFLAAAPSEQDRWRATYERGLCHAIMEKWSDAVADFEPLATTIDPDSSFADNMLYELAWAYKKLDNQKKSIDTFTQLADQFSDSSVAAEANFHVGESLYDQGEFDSAAERYKKCLGGEPTANVGERAAYKLAWCAFEQENWTEAHLLFKEQIDKYGEGPLSAVGLSMLAESLFQNKNHKDAVVAYKIAVPAIRAATISDESVRILTPLHAAQSANQTGDYQSALTFAQSVIDEYPDSEYRFAAMFELGTAQEGLGNLDEAIATWRPVAEKSIDKIGARARAMIGDAFFKKKEYEQAITEFKSVMYGYPTVDQKAEIDPWRAFSAYETARCYYVQVSDANGEQRKQLIASAREWFEFLLKNYENDVLAPDARKQLETLNKLN